VRRCRNRSPEESERREKRRQAAASRRRAEKPTREQKLRRQLIGEAGDIFRRWHKEMKDKHGDPFPHVYELEGKVAAGFYKWSPASDELDRWRAWAALEMIVFGEPLPETVEHIAEYEEKATAEAAAKEAEEQRREAERREREQRYSQGTTPPQPRSRWGDTF
jgi:hypothetical protein